MMDGLAPQTNTSFYVAYLPVNAPQPFFAPSLLSLAPHGGRSHGTLPCITLAAQLPLNHVLQRYPSRLFCVQCWLPHHFWRMAVWVLRLPGGHPAPPPGGATAKQRGHGPPAA